MGRIRTETGAVRAIRRKGFLNCFSTPEYRFFVVSSVALSRDGSRLLDDVGHALMRKRKLELVVGDSFCAAYALALPQHGAEAGSGSLPGARTLEPQPWESDGAHRGKHRHRQAGPQLR